MEPIQWKEEYSVGVAELDEQHEELVMLINRLTEAGHRPERMKSALNAFDRYAKKHFRHTTRRSPFSLGFCSMSGSRGAVHRGPIFAADRSRSGTTTWRDNRGSSC